MKKNMLISMLAGALLLTSSNAFAQEGECTTDEECQAGWTCEEVGGYSCAVPACAEGEDCPEPEPCDSGVIMGCVPPPPEACDPAAAEPCADGLVCVTETYEECEDIAVGRPPCTVDPDGNESCEGQGDDEPIGEPSCETVSESLCLPPFLAECEVDADCGDGFTCESNDICYSSCEDTDVAPCAEGEECPEPSEPSCEEVCETGENYCELIEVECEVDADCDGDLVCADVSAYIGGGGHPEPSEPPITCVVDDEGNEVCDTPEETCAVDSDGNEVCSSTEETCAVDADGNEVCAGGGSDDSDGSTGSDGDGSTGSDDGDEPGGETVCTSDPDGNEVCEDIPSDDEPESHMYCLPADWERWVGHELGGDHSGYDREESGEPTSSNDGQNTDAPVSPEPGGEGEGDGDGDAPDTDAPGDSNDQDDSDDEATAAGCQSTGNQSPAGGLGLLAALGMMFGLRRRRR